MPGSKRAWTARGEWRYIAAMPRASIMLVVMGIVAMGFPPAIEAGETSTTAGRPDAPASLRSSPATTTIALLILSSPTSGFPLTEVYAAIRRPIERNTALRVAPLEAIGLDERDAALRACAGDAACFVRRVRAAQRADLLLTVSVDRPGEDLLLGLRLIDTRRRKEIGATGAEVPAGMSLEGAMARRLPDIVPPSVWGEIASIEIRSEPPAAEASIAGRSCVTPCRFDRLIPALYEVQLRKAGQKPWRETVTLERGRVAQVEARLSAPRQPFFEKPWFWTLVGVGVVAASVGGYFLFQQPDRETVIRFSRDATDGLPF